MDTSNTDTGDTFEEKFDESAAIETPSNFSIRPPPPREALITTAINFLQNDKIRRSPLNQKHKFLRSKGLTDEEIQIACERVGVFSMDPNSTVIDVGISGVSRHGEYAAVQKQTTFGKIKEILQSMALFSGIMYACYLFYKKYIEPFLFGKKKKTVGDSLAELEAKLETKMNELNRDMSLVKEAVVNNQQSEDVSRELHSFKNDLDAIKGLLLNRKQFASPLTTTVPPSIPAWQLTSSRLSQSDNDKNDDAGSGSGSSETEVVTKNSDSSIEMM